MSSCVKLHNAVTKFTENSEHYYELDGSMHCTRLHRTGKPEMSSCIIIITVIMRVKQLFVCLSVGFLRPALYRGASKYFTCANSVTLPKGPL